MNVTEEAEDHFVDTVIVELVVPSVAQMEMDEGSSLCEPPESLYEPPVTCQTAMCPGGIRWAGWMGSLQSNDVSDVSSDIPVAAAC